MMEQSGKHYQRRNIDVNIFFQLPREHICELVATVQLLRISKDKFNLLI